MYQARRIVFGPLLNGVIAICSLSCCSTKLTEVKLNCIKYCSLLEGRWVEGSLSHRSGVWKTLNLCTELKIRSCVNRRRWLQLPEFYHWVKRKGQHKSAGWASWPSAKVDYLRLTENIRSNKLLGTKIKKISKLVFCNVVRNKTCSSCSYLYF